MLVRNWMTENPITLSEGDCVLDAAEVMRKQNVRQFPVINDDGDLVGIVSDRDIRDAMPSKYLPGDLTTGGGDGLSKLRAVDIMTIDPIRVTPTTPMDAVSDLLAANKIGGLPVVDEDGKLVGIVTESDLCRFLCSATGFKRGGPQFAFRLKAQPGPLADLLDDLRSEGVRFNSVLTSYDLEAAGFRHAYIRTESLGGHTVESLAGYLSGKHELLFYIADGKTVAVN